jgi:hypothetical protein
MAKKTTVNKIDRALETPESSQKENQSPEEKREAYVRYRVSAPGGVHLRVGPGQACRSAAIFTCGTEILGEDASPLLREDRPSDASVWLRVPCAEGVGWVDGAYLERIADEPTD